MSPDFSARPHRSSAEARAPLATWRLNDPPHAAPATALHNERRARPRSWRARFRRLEQAQSQRNRSSTRSRAARATIGQPIRPAQLRRLRQRHKQRHLTERKLSRLFAEVSKRCGTDAFDIAAIRRKIEIKRQHLVLGQDTFDLNGTHNLAKLGGESPAGARLQESRHLHGEGRSTRTRYGRY